MPQLYGALRNVVKNLMRRASDWMAEGGEEGKGEKAKVKDRSRSEWLGFNARGSCRSFLPLAFCPLPLSIPRDGFGFDGHIISAGVVGEVAFIDAEEEAAVAFGDELCVRADEDE